jgi:hypothetical protein
MPRCDDGTLKADSALLRWACLLDQAANIMGRPINLASQYHQMLVDAGFTDVHVVEKRWPINRWTKDRELQSVGRLSEWTLGRELEAISMALLTRGLRWEREQVILLCVRARKVFMDPKVHAYFPVFSVVGMKPLSQ